MKVLTTNRLQNKMHKREHRTIRKTQRQQTIRQLSKHRTANVMNRRNTSTAGTIARNVAYSVHSVAKQNRLAREAEAKHGATEAANLSQIFRTMYNEAKAAQQSVTERGGGN